MKYRKYNNTKIEVDGFKFDSKKESKRYQELKILKKAGIIKDFKMQVPYLLIPSQKDTITKKTLERPVKYLADFVVIGFDNTEIVEDTKGMRTALYILKRKLMLYVHGIRIKEI